jgi:hypothetical protein
MSETSAKRFLWRRLTTTLTVLAMATVLLTSPVMAEDSDEKKVKASWDNTMSFGLAYRLDDQDPDLVGLANGGNAFSVNGDNGNLNYATGISSMALKWSSELQLDFGEHFGAFVRGFAFYDLEQEERDRARTPLTNEALERVGSRSELLDAYVWTKFDLGSRPTHIRLGEQVQNWGESTFIQGGINVINPVDVSALRVPGAELKDALLPVGLAWGNVALSNNVSVEGFYQYRWEEIKIDPPGSYFSTNDFAGVGGENVFLGFGSASDIPPFSDPTAPLRPFLGVGREANVTPDDGGQYGIALRWFAPGLANTEFGFYYVNYHSRLPLINARTGTLDGAIAAGAIGAAANPITVSTLTYLAMNPGDVAGAINAGATTGVGAGASLGASLAIANTAAQTGGNPAAVGAVTTAFATDAYSQTARYFLSYPEDITLFGLSFNTELATTGIALQGEASYRQDAPLQVDDVELLFAALAPINPVFAGNSGIPGEPGASQFADFFGEDYSTQFDAIIPGYILRDVWQIQATATKIFGPGWGADQSVLLIEAAMTGVQDMPDKSELRLEGAGTYTSGNPYHTGANPGAAHVGKAAEAAEYFADDSSWGYRLAGRMEFNNAIGAVTLLPRFSWQHDVGGVSPGPGGNFIEGRQALTIGLLGVYQNVWSGDLSYTRYTGAGRHNLINDRDFIAANVKYSF